MREERVGRRDRRKMGERESESERERERERWKKMSFRD